MSTSGNILAGFVKGFAGNAAGQMEDRQRAERELQKEKMLMTLRAETQAQLAEFEETLPSKVLDRERTKQSMDLAVKDQDLQQQTFDLNRQSTLQQMRLRDEDQAIQRSRLALEQGNAAQSRAESRTRMRALEAGNDNKTRYTDFNNVYQSMKEQGANAFELAQAQANWRTGLMEQNWTEKQQKIYISQLAQDWAKKAKAHMALPSLNKD